MFLQTIPKRNDNELTRLVYEAQKKEPLMRDFIKLIEENAQLIIYVIDEEKIRNIRKKSTPKKYNKRLGQLLSNTCKLCKFHSQN